MNRKAWQFAQAALAALLWGWSVSSAGQIAPLTPLRVEPGLVVVSAVNDRVLQKDYESVLRIESVGPDGIRSATDWALPDRESPDGMRRQTAQSLQRSQDSEHARKIILWHLPGDEETLPGTTAATPSLDVFNEVRNRGEAAIVVGAVSKSDTQGLGSLGGFFAGRKYFRGTLKKLGIEPVRVLVDGVPTLLNTMHAGGTVTVGDDRAEVEFWWLDDPATRFALKFKFQDTAAQVVRINRPGGQEDALAKTCRSELPGVYFLTDSAQLLLASEPAIQRIAAILKAHPEWTITIEGHTDRTGGDQHNLDLSKRRAEALKSELITKHGIVPSRLSTAGYGSTRPIDTNNTLDGRAHNRRVELLRKC